MIIYSYCYSRIFSSLHVSGERKFLDSIQFPFFHFILFLLFTVLVCFLQNLASCQGWQPSWDFHYLISLKKKKTMKTTLMNLDQTNTLWTRIDSPSCWAFAIEANVIFYPRLNCMLEISKVTLSVERLVTWIE